MGKAEANKTNVRKAVRTKIAVKSKISSTADIKGVSDIIDYNLDVIFVGVMPGCKSAENGHFYSGSNNQFYKLLHESGFIEKKLKPEEDRTLLEYRIGLVNICTKSTRKISLVPKEEIREGIESFLKKIMKYKPRFICFNGKDGFAAFMSAIDNAPKDKKHEFGFKKDDKIAWQDGKGFTKIYLLPSTGGLNTHYRYEEKKIFVKELKTLIDEDKPRDDIQMIIKREPDENIVADTSNEEQVYIKAEQSA